MRPLYARNSVSGTEFPARSVDQLIPFEERIGTGEVADIGGVADDAHAAPPRVKLERGRLHLEARRGLGREIERHLVRRARARRCDRAGETVLDRPMQMTAQEALDLRMPRDHFGERLAALEADAIHVSDERRKWRVVHEHDRRLYPLGRQRAIEPGEALAIEPPAAFAGNDGVDRDDSQRSGVDCVLDVMLSLS